jgi:hypothetical protein
MGLLMIVKRRLFLQRGNRMSLSHKLFNLQEGNHTSTWLHLEMSEALRPNGRTRYQ